MRVALVISSAYAENSALTSRPGFVDSSSLIAERLAAPDAGFAVTQLDATRDLPENLDTKLQSYGGHVESLVIYFAGYLAIKADRGPALLLDGPRLRAFPVSRLHSAISSVSDQTLVVADSVALVDTEHSADVLASFVAAAIQGNNGAITTMVAVQPEPVPSHRGLLRMSDLWMLALGGIKDHESGTPGLTSSVVHLMQSEALSFSSIAGFAYRPGYYDFALLHAETPRTPDLPLPPKPTGPPLRADTLPDSQEGEFSGEDTLPQPDGAPESREDQPRDTPPDVAPLSETSVFAGDAAATVRVSAPTDTMPLSDDDQPASPPEESEEQTPTAELRPHQDDDLAAEPSSDRAPEGQQAAVPANDTPASDATPSADATPASDAAPSADATPASDAAPTSDAPASMVPNLTNIDEHWAEVDPTELQVAVLGETTFLPSAPPPKVRLANSQPQTAPPSLRQIALDTTRPAIESRSSLQQALTALVAAYGPLRRDDEVDARIDLADIAASDGDIAAAISQLESLLLDLDSSDDNRGAVVQTRLAWFLHGQNRSAEALLAFERALEMDPHLESAFLGTCALYRDDADYSGLVATIRRRLTASTSPEQKDRLLELVADVWLTEANDPKLAIEVLNEWLELSPGNVTALERLVECYDIENDHLRGVEARERLVAALGTDPARRAQIACEAAITARDNLDDAERALAILQRAITTDPHPDLLAAAIPMAEDLQGPAEALRLARQWLLLQPRDPEVLRGFIRLLGETEPESVTNASAVLRAAGVATTAEAERAGWLDSDVLLTPKRSLVDEDFDSALACADLDRALTELLARMEPVLVAAGALGKTGKKSQLPKGATVLEPEKDTTTLVRSTLWSCRLFVTDPPELVLVSGLPEGIVLRRDEKLRLLLSRNLGNGHGLGELVFVAAREVVQLRPTYLLRAEVGGEAQLAIVLRILSALSGSDETRTKELLDAERKVARRVREKIDDDPQLGTYLRQQAAVLAGDDFEHRAREWLKAVDRMRLCAGVLACGHPEIALSMAARYPMVSPLTEEQQLDTIAAFCTTRSYARLREQLGITVVSTPQQQGRAPMPE